MNITGRTLKRKDFWALKDISFDVKKGERIGIIGRNGAGKSTLLKILSQISFPTEGQAKIKGKVTSLLEVGTGFNPNLTGRENIFLNASMYGLSKCEINSRLDDIVAFSELKEDFLLSPIKYYSSGMRMRLAFSIAAHLDPDILMLDEVLTVGDLAFSRKCLHKVEGMTEGGRTLLFIRIIVQRKLAVAQARTRCLPGSRQRALEQSGERQCVKVSNKTHKLNLPERGGMSSAAGGESKGSRSYISARSQQSGAGP